MFGSTVFDVVVGITFLYLVIGLICSAINEQISQFLSLRANMLWESICALVGDPDGTGVAKELYNHQLIRGLAVKQGRKPGPPDAHPADRPMPSYIPASTFALALHDIRASGAAPSNERLDMALRPLYQSAEGDPAGARGQVEDWYNAAMARATGWYKRKVQINLFVIALLIVTASNADTIMVFNKLWRNPAERTAIASQAQVAAKQDLSQIQSVMPAEASRLLGWVDCESQVPCTAEDSANAKPADAAGWLLKAFGLLLTSYAASLGAPFWFDLLKKFVTMRGGVDSGSDQPKQTIVNQTGVSVDRGPRA